MRCELHRIIVLFSDIKKNCKIYGKIKYFHERNQKPKFIFATVNENVQ